MLHNKHLEILSLFLGDYEKVVHGRGLIGEVKKSPKGISNSLNEMEESGILRSVNKGSAKHFSLNRHFIFIKDYLAIAEIIRKIEFLEKQKKIAHIFRGDARIVGIFGSYADGSYNRESDVDIFIIGADRPEIDYKKSAGVFDIEASVKLFGIREFSSMLKKKSNIAREIIRNHIIISNQEGFISLIWKDYYGYD